MVGDFESDEAKNVFEGFRKSVENFIVLGVYDE